MTNFNDFLNEQMKDPEFKAEWDALDPEFAVIEAILAARKESGLTQQQLSERTGIAQTDISKLERGNGNPSLRTLQRCRYGDAGQDRICSGKVNLQADGLRAVCFFDGESLFTFPVYFEAIL